jgi:hypothetical protein
VGSQRWANASSSAWADDLAGRAHERVFPWPGADPPTAAVSRLCCAVVVVFMTPTYPGRNGARVWAVIELGFELWGVLGLAVRGSPGPRANFSRFDSATAGRGSQFDVLEPCCPSGLHTRFRVLLLRRWKRRGPIGFE